MAQRDGGDEDESAALLADEAGASGAGSIYQQPEPAPPTSGRAVFLVLLPTIFVPCFLFTLATAMKKPSAETCGITGLCLLRCGMPITSPARNSRRRNCSAN